MEEWKSGRHMHASTVFDSSAYAVSAEEGGRWKKIGGEVYRVGGGIEIDGEPIQSKRLGTWCVNEIKDKVFYMHDHDDASFKVQSTEYKSH